MVNEPPKEEVIAPPTRVVVIESPIKVVIDVNKFLDDFLIKPAGKVVKWIKQEVEKRREQELEKRKFELIARLFGIKDRVGLRPGGEHPKFETWITPDTQEALFYLARLINSDKLEAQSSWIKVVNPAYNIICLGGPVANSISRQNMGYQRSGNEFLRISDFPINFPFSFDLSQKGKNTARLTKRYAGRKVHKEYNWGIITPVGSISPNVREGWLEEDYLLITRMPNLSNQSAWKERKELIIIGGTHGTSTRAIKPLFENKKVLQDITGVVGESRYYQFYYECLRYIMMTNSVIVTL